MSYKISKSGSVGRGLKRTAAGQIQRARMALSAKAPAVHEARRCFKKVRGVLRLARCGLGRKRFKRENAFFREAGRKSRPVRDAVAVVEALDGLSRKRFKGEPPEIVGELRRMLACNAQERVRASARSGAFTRMSRELEEELGRVKAWKLKDFTRKDASRALRRGCKACRRAFEAAHAEPTDKNLHEWRKRAKDFWHEMRLLRAAYPELRKPMKDVGALASILGEDRDLALLGRAVEGRKEALHFPDQMKMVLALLTERRKKLREEAFALAARWDAFQSLLKKS